MNALAREPIERGNVLAARPASVAEAEVEVKSCEERLSQADIGLAAIRRRVESKQAELDAAGVARTAAGDAFARGDAGSKEEADFHRAAEAAATLLAAIEALEVAIADAEGRKNARRTELDQAREALKGCRLAEGEKLHRARRLVFAEAAAAFDAALREFLGVSDPAPARFVDLKRVSVNPADVTRALPTVTRCFLLQCWPSSQGALQDDLIALRAQVRRDKA
jgi:hypothetical protein